MSSLQSRSASPPTRGDDRDEDINYTKEAFYKWWNLVYVAVALFLSLIIGVNGGHLEDFIAPLLLTMTPEALYLGVVPRMDRFQRAVRSKKLAGQRRDPSQKEIYRQLSRRNQRRYARLRQLEDAIEANYAKLSSASQTLLQNHLQKIDGLLEAHLNLLHRHERYLDYTEAATESEVRRSIEAVRDRLEEASPRVREVKERRLRVLKQRLRRFREGHENREVIEAQLQTIEDVVRYIHEQSWTLQDPDAITHQLDALLDEVEETQQSVQSVEEVYYRPPDELLEELEEEREEECLRSSSRPRQRG